MKTVVYVHGMGGSAAEAGHYESLFPDAWVVGFDYQANTPWEAKEEFCPYFDELSKTGSLILVANSIGAYFSMCAGVDRYIERAYFISPIVDMERLILDLLASVGATEKELCEKGVIHTSFGVDLSWEYLSYIRKNPLVWQAKTSILYGANENFTSYKTMLRFSKDHSASLTVMPGGEHWFHTEEEMCFLDDWIKAGEKNMKQENFIIRPERKEEESAVEELIRESFWNVYRPGCLEHYVMHVLRDDPAFVKELDFVMEQDGRLIGQNIFMKTKIDADDGREIPVLTMGPICIANDLKRKGYGKKLLDFSLQKAAEMGFGAVLFEGNIGFYGKSGFDYARNFGIRYHDLPEGADDSFFLCIELKKGYLDGVRGVYQTPAGYYVDEVAAEEFDKTFPKKEKLKLPGQLFG